MEIRTARIAVTTIGSNGAAIGSGSTAALNGFLLDAYVDYHASAPATTTVAITYDAPALGAIASVAAGNTDVRIAPRQAIDGAEDAFDRLPLNGSVAVAVGASNALTNAVVVTVRYLGL